MSNIEEIGLLLESTVTLIEREPNDPSLSPTDIDIYLRLIKTLEISTRKPKSLSDKEYLKSNLKELNDLAQSTTEQIHMRKSKLKCEDIVMLHNEVKARIATTLSAEIA